MNKRGIAKTASCRFDSKEGCYIVQSPLFDRCIGVAETDEEAWQIFDDLLDEYYIAYLEGKLVGYDKPGRPAKGYVDLHAQVKPLIKEEIASKAKELGISQGDMIEYLYHLQEVKASLEEQLRTMRKTQGQSHTCTPKDRKKAATV